MDPETLPWTQLQARPYVVTRTVRARWRTDRILGPGTAFDVIGEPVMSTGAFIAAAEAVAWEAVCHLLPQPLALLGTCGTFQHIGPAVVGDTLRLEVVLTSGCGNETYWHSSAYNLTTRREVGWLTHTAATTDRETFRARLHIPNR